MKRVWPIENEHGKWVLCLGDEIIFLENKILPSGATQASATLHDAPRCNRGGIITHIKVLRADLGGIMSYQLIAVRNIVGVNKPRE